VGSCNITGLWSALVMHILLLLHLAFVYKWRILIQLHQCILFGDINSVCIELHKVPLKKINREYTNDTILPSLKGLTFDSWSMFLEFVWFWPQMKAVTVKIMNSIWHRLIVLFILLISNSEVFLPLHEVSNNTGFFMV